MLRTHIASPAISARRSRVQVALVTLVLLFGGSGCSTPMPLPTVQNVDLERFMGDWFVLAHIPAGIERKAYNAVESYALRDDGKIATTYAFRKGSFEGPLKEYQPVGTVRDRESNATWDMQFLWPFRAEYRIVHLDDDYQYTIIGRTARDYVWIMARTPHVSEVDYQRLKAMVAAEGYDMNLLRRVPHKKIDPDRDPNTSTTKSDFLHPNSMVISLLKVKVVYKPVHLCHHMEL